MLPVGEICTSDSGSNGALNSMKPLDSEVGTIWSMSNNSLSIARGISWALDVPGVHPSKALLPVQFT